MIGQLLLIREFYILGGGNELIFGIVLSNWLLLEALGALGGGILGKKIRRTWSVFVFLYAGYSLVLGGAIFFSRDIVRQLFQTLPGEGTGYFPLFISSLLILLFPALLHGAHFPISALLVKKNLFTHNPEGKAYFYETLGTLTAGILFTFILARWDNVFQVYLGLTILQFTLLGICALFLFKQKLPAYFFLGISLLAGWHAGGISSFLQELSLRRQWFGKNHVHYSHSYHGNIMVFEEGEEYHFFYDGRPFLSVPYPETDTIHDFAHFTLGIHRKPETALIMGGAHGPLLREMLQHPLQKVIYTEIDPELIRVMDQYFPLSLQTDLEDERLEKIYQDGRLYLAQTHQKFDYIAIGFITPETLQTNRYFTREFFRLVESRLDEMGMFVFSLPGSLHYLSPALRELHATIHGTLDDIFPKVKIIPGETTIYFASRHEITLCSDTVMKHLQDRNITSGFIHPSYLEYRFSPDRQHWFHSMIRQDDFTLNRDFFPRGFYHASQHWQQQFSPTAGRIQKHVERLSFFILLGIIAGIGILWLFHTYSKPNKKNSNLMVIIGTTGMAGMAFDLIILFLFQCLYGYVYQMIGLLMALFMLGTFIGSRWSIQQTKLHRISILLAKTEGFLLIGLVFIYIVPHIFSIFLGIFPDILAVVTFTALTFGLGFLIGAQFPLAACLKKKQQADTSQTASLLYASDLLGGWAGGLIFSLFLFPYFGLTRTLIFLGTIKIFTFASLVVPLIKKHGY